MFIVSYVSIFLVHSVLYFIERMFVYPIYPPRNKTKFPMHMQIRISCLLKVSIFMTYCIKKFSMKFRQSILQGTNEPFRKKNLWILFRRHELLKLHLILTSNEKIDRKNWLLSWIVRNSHLHIIWTTYSKTLMLCKKVYN